MKSCRTREFPTISVDNGGEDHCCNEGTASYCHFDDTVWSYRRAKVGAVRRSAIPIVTPEMILSPHYS
ncbi:MAG: hypothetical protein NTAFB01_16250 [Nitrospira sp.]